MHKLIKKAVISSFFLLLISNTNSATMQCSDIDGARVVAFDGTYLGFFGSPYALDSIMNRNGPYGSSIQPNMRNNFSSYGSSWGLYSARNQNTITPPRIIKRGVIVGYVSNNILLNNAVSLIDIDAVCTSLSALYPVQYPYPPGEVSSTDGDYEGFILTEWSHTDSFNVEGYNIYSSTSPDGPWTFIKELEKTETAIRLDTLNESDIGVIFYIGVTAYNDFGESLARFDSGFSSPVEVIDSEEVEDNNNSSTDKASTTKIRPLSMAIILKAMEMDDQ